MQCPSISLPGICAGVIGVFALISIGISSWQFQDHDLEHDLFFKCKDGYARPFVAEVQQGDQSAIFYCGWDAGLTSYRLLVAIFSLILSPALPWLITKRRVLFWLLLCLSITWICVLSIDIVALNAGRTVCRRGKESFPDYYNCHNDVYGATIAHDLMMCLSVFLTWVVLCPTNGKVLLTEQPAEEYVTCSGNHH